MPGLIRAKMGVQSAINSGGGTPKARRDNPFICVTEMLVGLSCKQVPVWRACNMPPLTAVLRSNGRSKGQSNGQSNERSNERSFITVSIAKKSYLPVVLGFVSGIILPFNLCC